MTQFGTRGWSAVVAVVLLAASAGIALSDPAKSPGDSLQIASADSMRRVREGEAPPNDDSSSLSEEPAPSESVGLPAPSPGIPVLLGGEEIFAIRSGRDGLDASARAGAVHARVEAAIRDRRAIADSARVVSGNDGLEAWLGPRFLWVITPEDVGVSRVEDLRRTFPDLRARITAGIEAERRAREPARLLLAALLAAGLSLLALAVQGLLSAGGRRWRAWLEKAVAGHLPALRFRQFEILSQARIAEVVVGTLGRIHIVVSLLLLYGYLTLGFSLFPWTQGWSQRLLRFALDRALEILNGIAAGVPGIITLVIVGILFRWLVRLSDRFFDALDSGALTLGGFHPELARPSKRLARILLWLVALLVAYPYVPGAQSKAVQGLSILLGVMISLGSTGFVGNIIAGLVLTYSRSYRVGDRVRIGDHVGDIVSLGFFATKLRSIRNEEVTIPNGQVAAGSIVNFSRLAGDGGLILHTEVTLGYDVAWRTVHGLLVAAALEVEGVEREPAPWVYQRALNDYHVSYELNCATRDPHAQLRLYSDLHASIQDAFSRAGVEILSPAYHALRDANAAVLPDDPKGPRPAAGGFRVLPNSGG